MRDGEETERSGHLAHELRGYLNTAFLALEALRSGSVGIAGRTGAVLARSLGGLRNLIDRELTEVRLGAGVLHKETIGVRALVEDIEVATMMEADARGLKVSVSVIPEDVTVHGDRQILTSVVSNLLHNAFKFTRAGGHIVLHAYRTDDRVLIDIKDECGGLPPGKLDDLFRPFEQQGADRTGLGLGLSICKRGAEVHDGTIRVKDEPGTGCVFTLDLPRPQPQLHANGV